jgi:hypothetical protein
VGAWTQTSSLNIERADAGKAVVRNGFIYIVGGGIGGVSGNGYYPTTEYAAIQSDGGLSAWQTGSGLNTGRTFSSIVENNGVIYAIGGDNVGNRIATTERATLQSISRKGSFSKYYDFEVGVKPAKLITRGSKLTDSTVSLGYMTTDNASSIFGSQTASSDVGFGGNNAIPITISKTLSRYGFLRYTLDDSMSAVFPDSGNESTITDFDLYYTSNPGTRLRNGRTFTNGEDRGLQASPQ